MKVDLCLVVHCITTTSLIIEALRNQIGSIIDQIKSSNSTFSEIFDEKSSETGQNKSENAFSNKFRYDLDIYVGVIAINGNINGDAFTKALSNHIPGIQLYLSQLADHAASK